ncbi:hypothetical protein [Streptomyces reniochalinae]|nr:hypothetical protein [Streptomyces reniochalinae]
MYTFFPEEGEDWPNLFECLADALRERDPNTFIRSVDNADDPIRPGPPELWFGITIADEELDGFAAHTPTGVALKDATPALAAEFAHWLRDKVTPSGAGITFNTSWGLEDDMPSELLPHGWLAETRELIEQHVTDAVDLNEE